MGSISKFGKTLAATMLVAVPLMFGVAASQAAEGLSGTLLGAGLTSHSVGEFGAPPGVGLGSELGLRLMP